MAGHNLDVRIRDLMRVQQKKSQAGGVAQPPATGMRGAVSTAMTVDHLRWSSVLLYSASIYMIHSEHILPWPDHRCGTGQVDTKAMS